MLAKQIWNPAQGTSPRKAISRILLVILALVAVCCILAAPSSAQEAPYYSPQQLDRLVSRVALYPDPLLAQVLAAATFPDDIPDAARWADRHRDLSGNELAYQIQDDQLPWDPSVQALLPFPNVLDNMAQDMRWTSDLGNAFLSNQTEVMYAVQRMRQRARDYGYLRTGPQMVVSSGPYITIVPARPDYIVVPYYDPIVVYERPRPGFVIGTAIVFRFGVGLGASFRPWGWGYNRIAWNERVVVINNSPWHRTWVNRREYHHPYVIRQTVVVEHREHDRGNSYYAHQRNEERKAEHWEEHKDAHRDIRYVERKDDHDRDDSFRHDDHGRRESDRHDDHGRRESDRRDDHGQSFRHDDHDRDDHGRGNYGHDNHGNDDHSRGNYGHDNRGNDDHGRSAQGHDNHGADSHGNGKQNGHDSHGNDDHGKSKQARDDHGHGDHDR